LRFIAAKSVILKIDTYWFLKEKITMLSSLDELGRANLKQLQTFASVI